MYSLSALYLAKTHLEVFCFRLQVTGVRIRCSSDRPLARSSQNLGHCDRPLILAPPRTKRPNRLNVSSYLSPDEGKRATFRNVAVLNNENIWTMETALCTNYTHCVTRSNGTKHFSLHCKLSGESNLVRILPPECLTA
jgi:hypothetical protein